MNSLKSRYGALALGATCMLIAGAPALADDSEIFVNAGLASGARPNVLFIIDTSLSMDGLVEVDAPYDPAETYAGSCPAGRVYYVSGTDDPPACSSAAYFPTARNHCSAATTALATGGTWTGKAAQFRSQGSQWRWRTITANNREVECGDDAGAHGSNASPSPNRWASNATFGSDSAGKWTNSSASALVWAAQTTYTFYNSNWLNWYHGGMTTTMTRLEIVKQVSTSLASSINNVNLGLMRFDAGASGGMITHEVAPIETARATIISRINSYSASSFTPLSETLYEAGQYFRGGRVKFGLTSSPTTSVPGSIVTGSSPAVYKSPIQHACQKNVIILLTDGEPTLDFEADTDITAWPSFAAATGSGGCSGIITFGRCLDEAAEYLYNKDNVPGADLSSTVNGIQNVLTYTVGFGPEVAGSATLDNVAAAGGTSKAFQTFDVESLTVALQKIFRDLIERNTTFVTPTVAVNAFNRAQSLDDLYVSVFKPTDSSKWLGNLKKYRLYRGEIVDAEGANAIGTDGFFAPNSRSIWSADPDSFHVERGGAASRLPAAGTRRIYTDVAWSGSALALHNGSHNLSTANAAVTDALLGTGGAGQPTKAQVIDWLQGYDVRDEDNDGDTTEQIARFIGDPLHGRPGVVTYGQVARDGGRLEKDTVVYLPTNDGLLHAINGWSDTASGGGEERWAFAPREVLARLKELYENDFVTQRSYGLDGDVRVLKLDYNLNGVVDGSDRVILYFGMRSGGSYYYAIDVTDRDRPRLIWKVGPSQLPGIGETWSPPSITRVNIPTLTQNSEYFVLIFGGGYDQIQENYVHANDTVGNRIYMVDAFSGTRLWYAGGPGAPGTPNLALPAMKNSIPGRITVVDTNADMFADRMYAADLGGRVWRFDIWNGRAPNSLVTGGVIAKLGAGDVAGATIADTRRFYSAPDAALVQRRGSAPYFNLAIGSGYRGHPLHKETNDYFFSIRDKEPFKRLTQAEYNARTPLVIGDLVDKTADVMGTAVPANAPGWRLALQADGVGMGEKALSEATTLNNVIMFPTYQPASDTVDVDDPCRPQSVNRVYALLIDNGKPALDFDNDGEVDGSDLFTQLGQRDGIVGDVQVGFMRSQGCDEGDTDCESELEQPPVTNCIAGVEVLGRCVDVWTGLRTFWEKEGT